MTIQVWKAAAVTAALWSSGAAALDLSAMTDAERADFGAAVREYLIENPEVLMEAIGVLEERQAAEQAAGDAELVGEHAVRIFEDDHSWRGGNPDGDVTLVEFLDYRCSYCRQAHPEVAQLIDGDGEIEIVVKEFPILGPESVEASRFAIAVLQTEGDEAYKDIGDQLMAYRGAFDRDGFSRLAEGAGLDADAIIARMDSAEVTAVIAANHALGRDLEINGTPSFILEDRMLRGYLPLAAMEAVVGDLRGE